MTRKTRRKAIIKGNISMLIVSARIRAVSEKLLASRISNWASIRTGVMNSPLRRMRKKMHPKTARALMATSDQLRPSLRGYSIS